MTETLGETKDCEARKEGEKDTCVAKDSDPWLVVGSCDPSPEIVSVCDRFSGGELSTSMTSEVFLVILHLFAAHVCVCEAPKCDIFTHTLEEVLLGCFVTFSFFYAWACFTSFPFTIYFLASSGSTSSSALTSVSSCALFHRSSNLSSLSTSYNRASGHWIS